MISVLVPWRAGCVWREASFEWVRNRYEQFGWELVTGSCADGPFSRTQAILDAARRASGDLFVITDSDVWCDPTEALTQVDTWAIPHHLIHRLSAASTLEVLDGADWHGLALSDDNLQDRHPYRGHATGTLLVITRTAFDEAPPDPRFVGWGQEDDAWACALRTLVGKPWRGAADLVHLWHPPQPRQNRRVGNPASFALFSRYRNANGKRNAMRALIDEWRTDELARTR